MCPVGSECPTGPETFEQGMTLLLTLLPSRLRAWSLCEGLFRQASILDSLGSDREPVSQAVILHKKTRTMNINGLSNGWPEISEPLYFVKYSQEQHFSGASTTRLHRSLVKALIIYLRLTRIQVCF